MKLRLSHSLRIYLSFGLHIWWNRMVRWFNRSSLQTHSWLLTDYRLIFTLLLLLDLLFLLSLCVFPIALPLYNRTLIPSWSYLQRIPFRVIVQLIQQLFFWPGINILCLMYAWICLLWLEASVQHHQLIHFVNLQFLGLRLLLGRHLQVKFLKLSWAVRLRVHY